MNEEEKKTIEKFIEKCYKYDESVEIKGISVGEEYRMLNTVCKALNLIEKLQKENEELKFEERRRIIGKYGDAEIHDVINRTLSNDYIPVQKVKDNIKKLEIKKEKARGERDILERFAIEKSINSLQQLLYGRNK